MTLGATAVSPPIEAGLWTPDPILPLIDSIYRAALDPAGWREVMAGLIARFGGCAVLFLQDTRSDSAGFIEFAGRDVSFMRAYAEHFAPLNPARAFWTRLPEGAIVDSVTSLGRDAFENTEFYADFFRPMDVYHAIGTVVLRDGPVVTKLSLQRPRAAGPYAESELRLFNLLTSHAGRAIGIGRRLTAARWEREAASLTQKRQTKGLVFADSIGRVLHADWAAEAWFRMGGRIGLARERLVAADESETARIQAAIAAASRGVGATLSLPGPDGVTLSVLPWHGKPIEIGSTGPAVLILIEPGESMGPSGFASRYGLTPAEARLVEALARGDRIAAYAGSAGIGLATARTHLRSVFLKTGQRRQSDLMRLILSENKAAPAY